MRAWLEALNTALNWGIALALGVLALMLAIASIRSNYPTWRESHRRVKRKRTDEQKEAQARADFHGGPGY